MRGTLWTTTAIHLDTQKGKRDPKLPQRNSYLAAIVEHHLWCYIWCHIHFTQ